MTTRANQQPRRPTALEVRHENIPSYLVSRPQWLLWQYVLRGGRWTKVPFQPSGRAASSVDSCTWATFSAVWDAYQRGGHDGIGFALNGSTDDNGLTIAGVDMDGVKGNPEREARAREIITALGSYTEASPSGRGYRIFTLAHPLARSVNHDGLEFYAGPGRYLSVTGHVVEVAND